MKFLDRNQTCRFHQQSPYDIFASQFDLAPISMGPGFAHEAYQRQADLVDTLRLCWQPVFQTVVRARPEWFA